ncbi:MAG TPA: hypothetical protein VMT78_14925, partial [Terriglobia bacterium]|nr:hypothetical protein [Terriglobia bacterium]
YNDNREGARSRKRVSSINDVADNSLKHGVLSSNALRVIAHFINGTFRLWSSPRQQSLAFAVRRYLPT